MATTGLVIASGLAKAVDSFFKARKLRDLNAQAQSMEQIKYLKGLEDLNNSKLRGGLLTQKREQSSQIFPHLLRQGTAEADISESERKFKHPDPKKWESRGQIIEALSKGDLSAPAMAIHTQDLGGTYNQTMAAELGGVAQEEVRSSIESIDATTKLRLESALTQGTRRRLIEKEIDAQVAETKADKKTKTRIVIDDQDLKDGLMMSESKDIPTFNAYAEKINRNLSSGTEEGRTEAGETLLALTYRGLETDDRQTVSDSEQLLQMIQRSDELLSQYYETEGSGAISAAIEKAKQSGGAGTLREAIEWLTDNKDPDWLKSSPAMARLMVLIDSQFVRFRNQMTGAAFKDSESADLMKLFPDLSQPPSLNKSRIGQMTERTIEIGQSPYRRVLGDILFTRIFGEVPLYEPDQTEAVSGVTPTPTRSQPSQVATDYVKKLREKLAKLGITVDDIEVDKDK